jgi:hypothetical protein
MGVAQWPDGFHGKSYGLWLAPLKNDGVKVSLDDDIPNMMGKS